MAAVLLTLTGCASDGAGGGSGVGGQAGTGTIIGKLKAGSVAAQFVKWVNKAGALCPDISPPLIAAQVDQESGWNPSAHSPAGAEGIAQWMPGSWKAWAVDADNNGSASPMDPADAIVAQGKYMCSLAKQARNGSGLSGSLIELALAGYNAGWGAVTRAGGVPKIPETQNYVQTIPATAIRVYGGRWSQRQGSGPADADPGAKKVLAALQAELNTPYVWGGGTLTGPGAGVCSAVQPNACHMSGFDCSGYSRYGIYTGTNGHLAVPRTASEQQRYLAKYNVPFRGNGSLKPGDVVFEGEPAEHVAVYWGDGKIIEEPHPGAGAHIVQLFFKPATVARVPFSKFADK